MFLKTDVSTMAEAQIARKGWSLPCPFLETGKILFLWVKCFMQNAALRVSRNKNIRNIFLCVLSVMCCRWNVFIEVPLFQETSACTVAGRLLAHLVSRFVCGNMIIIDASSNSPIVYGKSFLCIRGLWLVWWDALMNKPKK